MKKFISGRIALLAVLMIVVSALAVSTPRLAKFPSQTLADNGAASLPSSSNLPRDPQGKPTPDPREEIVPPIKVKNAKVKTIRGTSGPEIPLARKISPRSIVKTNKPSRQIEKQEHRFSAATLEKMKRKDARKRQIVERQKPPSPEESAEGNSESKASFDIGGGGNPPDNTVAVSENGFIVSADNNEISFLDTNGAELDSFSYPDFLSELSTANVDTSDPKVIYDAEDNRFIFCIQFEDLTKVAIGFSTAEDPRDPWNFYLRDSYSSDADGLSFDFPSLSVNYHEVFLAGNIFNDESHRVGNMIIAMDKDDGYAGRGLTWKRWKDVTPDWSWESVGQMFGVRAARAAYYGPGHYFVSTKYSGGNELFLFHVTDHIFNDPVLEN